MSSQTLPSMPSSAARAPAVTFGPFEFDAHRRFLRREGTEIPLPPRVLGVLELLLARAGDVVSRQEIIDAVWKEAFVTDTSLAEAVSFLRQALGDDPQSPTYIQTVHRRGYRFVAPLTETPASKALPVGPFTPPSATDAVKPSIVNELLPWSVATLAVVLAISAIWYSQRLEPVTPPGDPPDARTPAQDCAMTTGRRPWRFRQQALRSRGRPATAARASSTSGRSTSSIARALPDTEGAAAPFFSPDERWLGFFVAGKLKKVALAGGAASIIADASQPFGAAWLPDGRIVYAASMAGGLMRVSESGGEPQATDAAGRRRW